MVDRVTQEAVQAVGKIRLGQIDAVFLDRDGTLIWDRDYLSDPEQVELIPGVQQALQQLRQWGVRLYLFTNQSGVARGYFSLDCVIACNEKMLELIGLGDDLFSGVCIATDPPGTKNGYRKPSPRYIQEVLRAEGLHPRSCFMVGDRLSDWESGVLAGISSIAVRSGKQWGSADQQYLTQHQIAVYDTLSEWVDQIAL